MLAGLVLVNGGGEGGKKRGREDEPKGRWIWTPLTRSFLVYLGEGMLGGGCGGNAKVGMFREGEGV